jgi:bifunctional non-homologous end joining protein LigD
MLLLRTEKLPEGNGILYELKFDGFRAIAFKTGGKVYLRSRNDKGFTGKYRANAKALAAMPDDRVIDGEIVALDGAGRPSFSAVQNYGSASGPLFYYVFDVMIAAGRDVTAQPLEARREILARRILSKLADPIRESPQRKYSASDRILRHYGYFERSEISIPIAITPMIAISSQPHGAMACFRALRSNSIRAFVAMLMSPAA